MMLSIYLYLINCSTYLIILLLFHLRRTSLSTLINELCYLIKVHEFVGVSGVCCQYTIK